MNGFGFGSPEDITAQITKIIESDDFKTELYLEESVVQSPNTKKKRGFGFGFHKIRSIATWLNSLITPSTRGLRIGIDSIHAFHPLISVYYLVLEKQERARKVHDIQVSCGCLEKHSPVSQPGCS
jgi:hypothetical protein